MKLTTLEAEIGKQKYELAVLERKLEHYRRVKAIKSQLPLIKQCGVLRLTGQSGRIGEDNINIVDIRINDIAGCQAIPEVISRIVSKRLKELDIQS